MPAPVHVAFVSHLEKITLHQRIILLVRSPKPKVGGETFSVHAKKASPLVELYLGTCSWHFWSA
jgi:hypothetical protein